MGPRWICQMTERSNMSRDKNLLVGGLLFDLQMRMDIQACLLRSFSSSTLATLCSQKNSQKPNRNGDGDKFSTDWDKAWSKFKKQGKKTLFPKFSPNKYVSWNPRRSDYPLSEEVDPIKRTEKSNLMLWTSPRFTLFGAIIIVTFLLVYTILSPIR